MILELIHICYKRGALVENININEIDGVKIGNAQDYNGGTGITVILCPKGARAGVDIEVVDRHHEKLLF